MRKLTKFWTGFKGRIATVLVGSNRLNLLMLIVCMVCLPAALSPSCIGVDRSFHGYTFINLNLLDNSQKMALAPLFYRFDKLYEEYFKAVNKSNQNDNIAEWTERYCNLVPEEDIAYIVYKASIEDLELLRRATMSKSLQVPGRLQDNGLAYYLWKNKCLETIEYLMFAKSCEPYVSQNDKWEALPRNKEQMLRLIQEGKNRFRRTKSHYIKLRYAYQIIRLAHYSGDFNLTLALYDELTALVDKKSSRWNESIIPWWIMGHRAGALRSLGNHVEASYYYALVFMHCPGRRSSAYLSFLIKNDKEWEDCLRLCQSDEERATLYAIRAANAEGRALDDMKKIYELDPRHDNLEILLVQELRKMERNLLGLEFNDRKAQNKQYFNLPRPYAGSYIVDLLVFVRECRKERQTSRPVLWHLAEGYLEFLSGDFYSAERTFKAVAASADSKLLSEQLDVMSLALSIAKMEKADEQAEEFALKTITDNQLYTLYPSFTDYLRDRMSSLYLAANQKGKAFLCTYTVADFRANPKPEMIDDLLAISMKKEKTSFERLLLQKLTTDDILDIKATLYFSNGEVEAANEIFKQVSATAWDDYGQFEPFKETFKDCIRCFVHRDTSVILSLNKGELLQQLINLEYKAKSDLENAASHYYRLGLAWYNMSYFGYDWKARDYFRSGSTWPIVHASRNQEYLHPKFTLRNRENTDLSKAYGYFEKALELAQDPELAAKAAFQAARCEQKMFFMSGDFQPNLRSNRIPQIPSAYSGYFQKLKSQYQKTNFYQQIIRECKYFAAYARR
jgi:hypothetical protein